MDNNIVIKRANELIKGRGDGRISVNDIKRIIRQLTERNIGILITDHNVRETLDICDSAYIVNEGRIIFEGSPKEVLNNDLVKQIYLGEDFRM